MNTLTVDENPAFFQIQAYQAGKIQINNQIYTHNIIISPNQLIEDWCEGKIADLQTECLTKAANLKPDILLLGTGEQLIFPPIHLYGELLNQGIGIEIMDTRAACRTFQALTAENRHVVAALFLR